MGVRMGLENSLLPPRWAISFTCRSSYPRQQLSPAFEFWAINPEEPPNKVHMVALEAACSTDSHLKEPWLVKRPRVFRHKPGSLKQMLPQPSLHASGLTSSFHWRRLPPGALPRAAFNSASRRALACVAPYTEGKCEKVPWVTNF